MGHSHDTRENPIGYLTCIQGMKEQPRPGWRNNPGSCEFMVTFRYSFIAMFGQRQDPDKENHVVSQRVDFFSVKTRHFVDVFCPTSRQPLSEMRFVLVTFFEDFWVEDFWTTSLRISNHEFHFLDIKSRVRQYYKYILFSPFFQFFFTNIYKFGIFENVSLCPIR